MIIESHKRLYLRWRGNIVKRIEVRQVGDSSGQLVFDSSRAKHNCSALLLALYYQNQLQGRSLAQEQFQLV
jgi:hypothetical protein